MAVGNVPGGGLAVLRAINAIETEEDKCAGRTVMTNHSFTLRTLLLVVLGVFIAAARASAHCDTLDGPVVAAVRSALNMGDVTPVLKWVRAVDEQEIKAAFARSTAVRSKGAEARELADLYFFETVVRLHRAGEGAPYTGLKPAGTDVSVLVKEADKAIDGDPAQQLIDLAAHQAAARVKSLLSEVKARRAHMNDNVAAGREFVAAYIQLIHYLEQLEQKHENEPPGGTTETAAKDR
jgi:hypothetical protein